MKEPKLVTLEAQKEAGLIDTVVGTTPVYTDEKAKAEAFRLRKLEASKKMIARKQEALKLLVALALREGTEEEKKAARYLEPGRHLVTKTPTNELLEALKAGPMDELAVFQKFRMGRHEMKAFMKKNPGVRFEAEMYGHI